MAAYGLDVECPHIFDGTHFARWRNWMQYVGFSCAIDKKVATQAQKKCLHLDCQATNIFYSSMKDNIFGEIMDMKSAHEILVFLNEKYGAISKEDDMPKVDANEDVEHDHNMVVVQDCSTSWSSDCDDDATTRSHDKDNDDATSDATNDATSCTLDDEDDGYESDASTSSSTTSPHCFMSHGDTKVSIGDVIIDCDDACSTSMSCETNILKENNKLKNEVKNLSNKLERCYYSKVTFEHILKTQRNYGDKCGLDFKKKMTKGERKQEKRMKKLLQKKLSHTMCYRCHEAGHLANGCPNIEKLKKMKEEERLKHVKCFKCRTWGHLTSMCPTKQLVKHQAKPQQKLQVEQEKKPQAQVKIYHEDGGDMGMMKKKTRRGGRQSRSSKDLPHIKCFECKNDGHFASKCPTKLEKKVQATLKRQGNEKQHKEEKAQSKRSCYLCRERGHMAHSCPLGNNSKPISIDNHNILRKDGDGTSMVAIAKHPAIHTKASPKYVAPNLRGPKLVWVPSKNG
ncbi:hypothetical protein BDA96_05G063300 [Sorghum bicolor]|uniref:CCHC-type domain-containing protein n=1 Tax=Sorghum bicolor TaxID=4558 RepID=A0A921UFH8_SORBI|nr:hypothetical protein BDA96_05G063300 [Sorghum bicolor]